MLGLVTGGMNVQNVHTGLRIGRGMNTEHGSARASCILHTLDSTFIVCVLHIICLSKNINALHKHDDFSQ